jgi:CO/xanthine dehydrogenase Mo-binding subunit
MAVLRSPMAHARIGRIDVSAALERPASSRRSPAPTCATTWRRCRARGR